METTWKNISNVAKRLKMLIRILNTDWREKAKYFSQLIKEKKYSNSSREK